MPAGGLLGIPFPLYGVVDRLMASVIGATGSILVWSLLCSAAVLFIYRHCSPQKKLRVIKDRMREIGGELNKNPDDLSLLLRLSGENIKIAFKRFLLTFLPTCVAVLPLLSLATWLNSHYGYQTPLPGEKVIATAMPVSTEIGAGWASMLTYGVTNTVEATEGVDALTLFGSDGTALAEVTFPPRGNVIAHKKWWNLLLGNPVGYLPVNSAPDAVLLDFDRREFIGFGPDWMRGWEAVFLVGMTVFSIGLKVAFKVE